MSEYKRLITHITSLTDLACPILSKIFLFDVELISNMILLCLFQRD